MPDLDRDHPRRQVPPQRTVRGCPQGRHCPLPGHQQAQAWLRRQDQHLWWTVQDDGEHHQVSIIA